MRRYRQLRQEIRAECPQTGEMVTVDECERCYRDQFPYGCPDAQDVIEELYRKIRGEMHIDDLRMVSDIYKGSRRKDWQTPKWLYEEISERWGPFNLDPCTTKDNPLGTTFFFTEEDDGLDQPWGLVVERVKFFMNPPYGREISKWVAKAHKETQKWHPWVTGVGLLPVRTDPKWFHEYVLPFYELILLPGRIAFIDPDTGKPVKGTNFASMLVIYR